MPLTISPLPALNSTDWYQWASDLDGAVRIAPTITADTVAFTAAGTLVAGARNTVDGTSAAFTVLLPPPSRQGQTLSVERIDTGANTVSIAAQAGATLRGNAAGVVTMAGVGAAFESMFFVAESATSWFVIAGHKTKTWLDILYALKDATSTVKGGILLTGDLGGTASSPTVPALAAKAPLASPALTGTPTAPTAAAGANTTQLATTAFVAAALAALVNGAPGALDQLNELATALGNDPNFSTTIINALALKAPLASPALTGTPTAPTAAAGTNTTQLSTTAYALAAIAAALVSPALTGTPTAPTASAGTSTTQVATTAFVAAAAAAAQSSLVGVNAQTASYTLVAADAGKLVTENPTAAATITVPTNATVPYAIGAVVNFANLSAYAITIAGASGVSVLSPAGLRITAQNAQGSLVKIATDTWLLSGQTVT